MELVSQTQAGVCRQRGGLVRVGRPADRARTSSRREGDRGCFIILDPRLASRFCTAFPDGVRISRVGLVDAQILAARGFLSAAENRMKSLQVRANNFLPYAASPTARSPCGTACSRPSGASWCGGRCGTTWA